MVSSTRCPYVSGCVMVRGQRDLSLSKGKDFDYWSGTLKNVCNINIMKIQGHYFIQNPLAKNHIYEVDI